MISVFTGNCSDGMLVLVNVFDLYIYLFDILLLVLRASTDLSAARQEPRTGMGLAY